MSEQDKGKTGDAQNTPDLTKFVPKEEYEAAKSNLEKLQGDLERVKGQLLDPGYLEYLESKKDKAIKKTDTSSEVKDALGNLTAEEIERLPKARLLEIAQKRVSEELTGKFREELARAIGGLQSTVQNLVYERELAQTKAKYADFDEFEKPIREILERPGTNYTFEDAYILARAQSGKPVGSNEKKPAAKLEKRSSGEKPSSTAPAEDFQPKDYKDKDEASQAAVASVRAKYNLEGDTL